MIRPSKSSLTCCRFTFSEHWMASVTDRLWHRTRTDRRRTMGRQGRRLLFKVIIGIPIVWFSVIGFLVVLSGGGVPSPHGNPFSAQDRQQTGPVHPQPVLEKPNFDQLRFQQKMHEDGRMGLKNQEDQRRSEKAVVVTQRMQRDEKMAAAGEDKTVFPDAPGRFIVVYVMQQIH